MRALALTLALAASTAIAQPSPEQRLSAVVGVRAKIQQGTGSAATLGAAGAGGRTVPANRPAFDHPSGFGLLELLAPLEGRPLALGHSAALAEREPAMVVSAQAREGPSLVY